MHKKMERKCAVEVDKTALSTKFGDAQAVKVDGIRKWF